MKLQFLNASQLTRVKESKLMLTLVPALKEERTKTITALCLTFATAAFFGVFAISPTLSTITDLQKQLDDNRFVDQQLQTKIANLTTLQTAYNGIENKIPPVLSAIPKNPDIDFLVAQLRSLALNANVQVNRIQTFPIDISSNTTSTKYNSYSFGVEVQGATLDIQRFITSLGTFNRLVTIDNISMTNASNNNIDIFRISIRGNAFFKD